MLKLIASTVWVWDAEWVPDAPTIRRVYGLAPNLTDTEVIEHAYREAGATPENPRPYLKTILCRIVSIAAVERLEKNGQVASLKVVSVPRLGEGLVDESVILQRFLDGAGRNKPQLVGFNTENADFPILVQRALVNRVTAPKFCDRPNKPWEGVDYFGGKQSDWNLDLLQIIGGRERRNWPSVHQLAAACGIPAKHGGAGDDVAALFSAGRIAEIIRYNQRDALTEYLIWLRLAYFAGKITSAQLDAEENLLVEMLLGMYAADTTRTDLVDFVQEWRGTIVAAMVPATSDEQTELAGADR